MGNETKVVPMDDLPTNLQVVPDDDLPNTLKKKESTPSVESGSPDLSVPVKQDTPPSSENTEPIDLPASYETLNTKSYSTLQNGQKYFTGGVSNGQKVIKTWDANKQEFIPQPLLDYTVKPKEKGFIEEAMRPFPEPETEESVLGRVATDAETIRNEAADKFVSAQYLSSFQPIQQLQLLEEAYKENPTEELKQGIDTLKSKKLNDTDFEGVRFDGDKNVYQNFLPAPRVGEQLVPNDTELPKLPKTDMTVGEAYNEMQDNKDYVKQAVEEVNNFDSFVNQTLAKKLPEDKQQYLSTLLGTPMYNDELIKSLEQSDEADNVAIAYAKGLEKSLNGIYEAGSTVGLDEKQLYAKMLTDYNKEQLFGYKPQSQGAEIAQSLGGLTPDVVAGAINPALFIASFGSRMPEEQLKNYYFDKIGKGEKPNYNEAWKYAAASTVLQGGLMLGAGAIGGAGKQIIGETFGKRAAEIIAETAKRAGKDAFAFGYLGTDLQNRINKAYGVSQNNNKLKSAVDMGVIGTALALVHLSPQALKSRISVKTKNEVTDMAAFMPPAYVDKLIKDGVDTGKLTDAEGNAITERMNTVRRIASELPKELSLDEINELVPLYEAKDKLLLKQKDASPTIKDVLKGQIADLDQKILVKAAIPLSAEEKAERASLIKKEATGEGDIDKLRLKQLNARHEAVKEGKEQAKANEIAEELGFDHAKHLLNAVEKKGLGEFETVQEIPKGVLEEVKKQEPIAETPVEVIVTPEIESKKAKLKAIKEAKKPVEEKQFITHNKEIVSGKKLTDATNKVADDMVESANKKRQEQYASHVTEKQKDEILAKDLAYAESVRNGENLNNLTIAQRINYELTGETIPLLPKENKVESLTSEADVKQEQPDGTATSNSPHPIIDKIIAEQKTDDYERDMQSYVEDFSTRLAGKGNADLRQEIMTSLSGKKVSKADSGYTAVKDALKDYFKNNDKPSVLNAEEGLPEGTTVIKAKDTPHAVEVKIKKKAKEATAKAEAKGISLSAQKTDLVNKMQTAVSVIKDAETITHELEKELEGFGIKVTDTSDTIQGFKDEVVALENKSIELEQKVEALKKEYKKKYPKGIKDWDEQWEASRPIRDEESNLKATQKQIESRQDQISNLAYRGIKKQLSFHILGDGDVRVGIENLPETLEMTKKEFPEGEYKVKVKTGVGAGGKRSVVQGMAGDTPKETFEIAKENLETAKAGKNKEGVKIFQERFDDAKQMFDEAKKDGTENDRHEWAREDKTAIESAKDIVSEAKKKSKDVRKNKDKLGIADDPFEQAKREAEADRELFDAYVDLAKEYIKHGVKTVEEFAKQLGEDVSDVVKRAWEKAKVSDEDFDSVKDDILGEVKKPRTTSAKNEVTDRELEELGLSERDIPEVKANQKTWEKAKADVDSGKVDPMDIADRVNDEEVPFMTDEEVFAMKYAKAKLFKDHDATYEKMLQAKSSGDKELENLCLQHLAKLNSDYESIATALSKAGTTAGRALQARKGESDLDYNLLAVNQRMRAKNGGNKIPEATQKRIEELVAKNKEAEEKLKAHEEKIAELEKSKAIQDEIDAQIKAKGKKENIAEKKQKANALIAEGLDDLAVAFGGKKMAVGDKSPSISMAVEKIAKGLLDSGLATAENVWEKVKEKVKERYGEELDDIYKDDAISINKKSATELIKKKIEKGVEAKRLKYALKKRQEELVEAGVKSHEDITAQITGELNGMGLKISEREVRDILSGYGDVRKPSQEDLDVEIRRQTAMMRLASGKEDVLSGRAPLKSGFQFDKPNPEIDAIKKELKQLIKELGLDEQGKSEDEMWATAIETWRKRKKTEIEKKKETLAKMKRGELPSPPKQTIKPKTEEDIKLQSEAQKYKHLIDVEERKIELANRNWVEKTIDWIPKSKRFSILLGYKVLGKLAAAGAWQSLVITPARKVIQTGLGKLPFLNRVAERAPTEGGISARSLAENYSQWWSKAAWEDVLNTLKSGKSDIDNINRKYVGNKDIDEQDWTSFVMNSHAAIKSLPKRSEYFSSVQSASEWAIKNGFDIKDAQTQKMIHDLAYNNAVRNIFMNKNRATDAYKMGITYLDKNAGIGGKMAAALLKLDMPIVQVPTNIANDISSYVAGLAKATWTMGYHGKGKPENLSPQQADHIMRSLGKQAIGAIGMGMAYAFYKNFGGFYHQGKKEDVKDESIRLGENGLTISSVFLHHPAFVASMFAADIEQQIEDAKKKGEVVTIPDAMTKATYQVAKTIPLLESPGESLKTLESSGSVSRAIAQSIAGYIPQVVKEIAKDTDTDEAGNPISRKPETFADQLKVNVPILREQVKGRLEKLFEDRATPTEKKTAEEKQKLKEWKLDSEEELKQQAEELGVEYVAPKSMQHHRKSFVKKRD